jgi:uncharacterized membrane protein
LAIGFGAKPSDAGGIALLLIFAVFVLKLVGSGISTLYDKEALRTIGNLVGFYVTTCAWAVLIGAVCGVVGWRWQRGKTSSAET